jgi:signal peptidase I
MSPSSFDHGDSLDGTAGSPGSSTAAGSGWPDRGESPAGATAVRLPQQLDYRLRGLGAEPTDEVPATPTRTDHHQRRHGSLLAKAAIFVALTVVAVVLLQAFVIQPFAVPGEAMSPTLQPGDRMLVVKLSLLEGPIHSGQIVVFHPPRSLPCTVVGGGRDLVLRVVALPGDTIWSVGDTIFVDGQLLRERGWYYPRFGQVGSTPIRSTTLASGQYFLMADNRSDACDSRVFGPISRSSVVGEAIAIVGRHGHVYFGSL